MMKHYFNVYEDERYFEFGHVRQAQWSRRSAGAKGAFLKHSEKKTTDLKEMPYWRVYLFECTR